VIRFPSLWLKFGSFAFAEWLPLFVGEKAHVPNVLLAIIELKRVQ
jgi:hypothetical protein